MQPRLDARAITAITISLVLWASAFAGIRAALPAYSPAHLALLRFLVASLALALYALVSRNLPLPAWRDVPGIALSGLCGITIYHLLLNFGEQHVAAGPASLLVNTSPILTALLATFFLRERLRWLGWLGIGVSTAGTLLIALGEGGGLHFNGSAFIVLLAALGSSLYFVLQKPYLTRYSGFAFTCYSIWAGTLCLLFAAPGLVTAVRTAPLGATLSVIYLGIFPAALAYVTWAYFIARVPASRAASFLYLSLPLSFLIAWVWLHEVPHPLSLLGGALALVGVVLVNQRGPREQQAVIVQELSD